MKLIKRNIFIVFSVCLILILFEIVNHIPYLSMFALGFLVMILALFIKPRLVQYGFLLLGSFISLWVVFMTHSVWLLMLALLMTWFLFKREDGHEFIYSGERTFHPFQNPMVYKNIVIQPQSKQRSLVTRTPMDEWLKTTDREVYYDQDINMVYIGGNTIIDLGNSFISEGERTALIRKIFGRTRIILPRDLALKLNISILSGRVVFEQEIYHLQGENFQWLTPEYYEADRRFNLIVSVIFGDVEVIIL